MTRGDDSPITRRGALGAAAALIAGHVLGSDKAMRDQRTPASSARESVTFSVGGQTVFGMLHAPAGDDPVPGVLILHGLVASKDQPHRIFVTLAEVLATRGVASLRIDLR